MSETEKPDKPRVYLTIVERVERTAYTHEGTEEEAKERAIRGAAVVGNYGHQLSASSKVQSCTEIK